MDYLEYQNYLAHARGSFGARVRKRIAGAKAAGSQILSGGSGSSGGGSVGGKAGRKWKSHKYIAIVNGRYIYPAKQKARETFTKAGRQAKINRLSRDAGRAQQRAATWAPRAKKAAENSRKASNAAAEGRDRLEYTKHLIKKTKELDKRFDDARKAVPKATGKVKGTVRKAGQTVRENLTQEGREAKARRLSRDAGRAQNRYVEKTADANRFENMANEERVLKRKNPNSTYDYDAAINELERLGRNRTESANKAAFESAHARRIAQDAKEKAKKKKR